MNRRSRFDWAVLVLTALTLLFMTGWWFFNRPPENGIWHVEVQRNDSVQPEQSRQEGSWPDSLLEGEVINLNHASAADLQRLPGIGAVRAQAIIAHREQEGDFAEVDDLLQVKGIGPVILEQVRPFVSVK